MTPALRAGRIGVLAVIIAALPLAGPAHACAFHTTKPERTLVDWLIEAETIVLARPAPQNPFRYAVSETLRGDKAGITLPFLVDTRRRQSLARDLETSVLFVRLENDSWHMLSKVNGTTRPLIDAVLERAPRWAQGYNAERFAMFEALQDHADPFLRALAIREIDKAPYAILRTLDLRLPAADLIRDLWTIEGYPYQSIRILLLGLSGSAIAREEIHGLIDSIAGRSWANHLGAVATALIELDGAAGLTLLEERFLANPAQTVDNLEQIIEALAIHRPTAGRDLASRIDVAIARYVMLRADGAAAVARQFAARADWSQAPTLTPLLEQTKLHGLEAMFPVASYVAQARAGERPGGMSPWAVPGLRIGASQ